LIGIFEECSLLSLYISRHINDHHNNINELRAIDKEIETELSKLRVYAKSQHELISQHERLFMLWTVTLQ